MSAVVDLYLLEFSLGSVGKLGEFELTGSCEETNPLFYLKWVGRVYVGFLDSSFDRFYT